MEQITTRVCLHNAIADFKCFLCGHMYTQYNAAVILFEGDCNIGDICPECAEAGPSGVVLRMREYAGWLRGYADRLESLQAGIAAATQWATPEDLDRAVNEEESLLEDWRKAETQAAKDEIDQRLCALHEKYCG